MEPTYWKRQTIDQPLFPDIIWSRPEQKSTAGKLLIIGGNLYAFAAPAEAFTEAEEAGAGTVRAVLPDATKKIVGRMMEHIEYAPSTPSGSFSQKALAELLDLASWSDGTLLAGDIGRNSETAIVLEKFITKYNGQLTITKDVADYVISVPETIYQRGQTLLVISFAQLQQFATNLKFDRPFTFDMTLLKLVETLHELSLTTKAMIVVKHLNQMHCAYNGQIISTKLSHDTAIWRVKTATRASVWWAQNPAKPLQAIATSLVKINI